jgi:hypothetical protein
LVLQHVTDALRHPSRHDVEPPSEDPAGGRHLQPPLPYEIVYYRDQKEGMAVRALGQGPHQFYWHLCPGTPLRQIGGDSGFGPLS